MNSRHRLHGHAIISDDDCIADADGHFPERLKNDADWRHFQAALDACAFTLVGRRSHEASPNHRGRRRIVMSRSGPGLERRADGHWWNADSMALSDVLARLLPEGGDVGVPGGQAVFDAVGPGGFATFSLARRHGVALPGGRGLFSACEAGMSAEDVLASGGLVAGPTQWLDEPARVSLVVWARTG